MTNLNLPTPGLTGRSTLSPANALRWSWLCWGVLLALPFGFLQWVIWQFISGKISPTGADRERWFTAAASYLIIVVPGSLFVRGRLFKDYWLGRPVPPAKYILATIAIGVALAIGGIFSLIGCLVTGSFMPNLIPALLALVLYALHWPTGRAMIRKVGNVDDPQKYEEPR